jgi:uncharacterized zinc-type alcohol dehydrogenase-like protein
VSEGERAVLPDGLTGTYSGLDRVTGEPTRGGYAKYIVVRQEFVLKVPGKLDVTKAAPLLCAGITTYSPLKTWDVGEGSRVGVVGMGGLGHMGIKLAAAMGAHVTVMSRTVGKEADARMLGAQAFLVTEDEDAMNAAAASFDLIISTIPVKHSVDPYIPLLDIDGTLVLVGQVGPMEEMSSVPLLRGRRR